MGENRVALWGIGKAVLPQETATVQRQREILKGKKRPSPLSVSMVITLKVPAGHKPHVAVDKC